MIDLDHVAIATDDIEAALAHAGRRARRHDLRGRRRLRLPLGPGAPRGGGGGMTVELLVEWEPEQNDFLARFLARHGPGQHHLTFKVPDLAATLERVRPDGFRAGERRPQRPALEGSLPPAARRRTAPWCSSRRCTATTPAPPRWSAARSRGDAFFEPEWWPAPPPRADDRATARAASCWRRRRCRARSASSPACSRARSSTTTVGRGRARVAGRWPRSGSSRTPTRPRASAGSTSSAPAQPRR